MQAWIQTIAMAALALSAASALHARQSQDPVRIASAMYLGDVPTIVAEELQLFAAQDLDVDVTQLASGQQSLARLRAGKAEFALMALTPMVLDRLNDADPGGADDPVILASLAHASDLIQIVTRDDSGIQQAEDFDGRRVAIDRGTNSEFVWWLYAQFHGLEHASVELVDLPFPEMADALIAGRVDAAVLWEPRVSILDARLGASSNAGLVHIHVGNLYAGKWVLVTTRRTAENRRALCRSVLAAYRESIEFVDQQPQESIVIFNRRMDLADGLLAGHWNALDYELTLDWGLIADLQEQFLWARAVGHGEIDGQLRILEMIEPGPLRDLRPDAARIPKASSTDTAP